ncbi:MAG: glycosyltransferase family 4 protein [Bacteroidota bacterium]|nr:glycosyltransferase family 4 protein [Bacteroidota bacterium]
MKRVLITAYTCCPDTGSESGNGWSWIMNYLANGFQVYCITSSLYKEQIEEYISTNKPEKLVIFYTDSKFSLKLFGIPVFGDYLHYYSWIIKAKKIINSLRVPFFHAHHITYSSIKFGTPLYNVKTRLILGPLGGSELPHRSLKKYLGNYYYFEYLKNLISYALAKLNPSVSRSIKRADIILTSNEIAEDIIQQYSDKETVRMFDAGLSDYFAKPFSRPDLNGTIQIIWIGTMFPRKGLNLAIEAISNLPEKFDYHFTIAGSGKLWNEAIKQVETLNIKHKVTFLGHVTHKEVIAHMHKSHVLLFPSLIDSCPTQIFEAFATGLPVVTLNHQGMKDQVIDGTGVKINLGSDKNYALELSKGILSIVRDNSTYSQYARNAYEYGQKQIWRTRIHTFLHSL